MKKVGATFSCPPETKGENVTMVNERDTDNNIPSLATDLILQGAEVVAMEHDQMRKFAVMAKRDPKEALASCLAELNAFPEEAEKAYYRIPRRSKECKHKANTSCKNCNWIEGPSVGTARVVSRHWGNCTAGVRIAAETDDHWDLEGRFLDFETNFSATRILRALKWVNRGGQKKHVRDLDPTVELQVFQGAVSKAYRNVVRDGVPEAIINRYWSTAKQLIAGPTPGKKLSKKAVKKVLDAFTEFKVSLEQLEDKTGKTCDQWTGVDAADLKGIHNALTEGHISVAAVFGGNVQEPEPEPEPETAPESKTVGMGPAEGETDDSGFEPEPQLDLEGAPDPNEAMDEARQNLFGGGDK